MAMIDVYGISESGKKVKIGTVEESQVLNPVGGTIFYIDDTADGTYSFYDSNGSPASAPSIGDDYTGYYYTVNGASKDKYYVASPAACRSAISVNAGTYRDPYFCWTYLDEANQSYIDNTAYYSDTTKDYTYLGYYGRVFEYLTFPAEIGNGKTMTNTIMAIQRNITIGGVTTNTKAYIQDTQQSWRGDSRYSKTIWKMLEEINLSKSNGCDDWYIPTLYELNELTNLFNNPKDYFDFIVNSTTISFVGTMCSWCGYFWVDYPGYSGTIGVKNEGTTTSPNYEYVRTSETKAAGWNLFVPIRSF